MATNLPIQNVEDSAAGTRLFFDNYGEQPLEFNTTEVDSAVAFFEKKGFDKDAALIVSSTLLKQAKLDSTPIYKILDTLSGFNGLQLSSLVGEILNNNRSSISTLGFRTTPVTTTQIRNIIA